MEMCRLHTAVFVALFTPAYLQFCHSVDGDCHSHDKSTSDSGRSRWNAHVSHLIKDLDRFKVSSKKLIGKSDV